MMLLAGAAMLLLALAYLALAVVSGRFRARKDPAEARLDGATGENRD
ncbi:hypothetical protein [Amycolatopsis acidicola]|nr:hypothetical protein [Amycolatopsis acidicola]